MIDSLNNDIKGYQIFEKLGEGGFGAVYLARQELLKRNVAIKIILPQFANEPDFVRRFEIEAELIARLEHPQIVPIYDFWRSPQGAYIIMRYVQGKSLGDQLALSTVSETDTLAIIHQISSALSFAHQHHVVHRDLKPENVLLDNNGHIYLVDFGIAKDLNQADDSESVSGGTLMYASPEQLTGDAITIQTDIYALGLLVYEMLTGDLPHDRTTAHAIKQLQFDEELPPTNPLSDDILAVLRRATHATPTERFNTAIDMADALRDAIAGDNLAVTVMEEWDVEHVALRNPYKGLLAFQEYDSDNFWGRDNLAGRLINRLNTNDETGRFLAVVGPSGSGKSSIVKAGLIPQLRDGVIAGSDNWFVVEMYPNLNPFIELEATLLRIAVNPPESLLAQLKQEDGLSRALKRILPADENIKLLLVIDQFEELFTQVEDEKLRTLFINSMLSALEDPRSRLRVVVTLRADFYHKPLQYHDFGELLRKSTEIVLPLSPDELKQAIQQPAVNAGAYFESGLVNLIVNDVSEQPGMLPLLQYALTQLFERRVGHMLTVNAYQELGGVTGALAKRADEIFAQLTDEQKRNARQLFLRLVMLGEGTEDTRRRVRQFELDSIAGINVLLEIYGQARLLTFDNDPITRMPTVEVAHEALIRNWDALRTWVNDSRDELRIHRNLTLATAEWNENDGNFGFLARDARLEQFESWAEQTDLMLSADEQDFITHSIQAREKRNQAERERKAHEAKIALRARNFQRTSAGLVGVVVLAVVAILGAINQSNEAQAQLGTATIAQGLALIAQQTSVGRENIANTDVFVIGETLTPIPATLDMIATEQIDAVNTREAVQDESYRYLMAGQASFLQANESDALAFAFEAVSIDDPPVDIQPIFYDIASQSHNRFTIARDSGGFNSVEYSPDSRFFATAGGDGTVMLWDSLTGDELMTFIDHNHAVNDVAFSPDGQILASAIADSTIKLWAVQSGSEIATLIGHEGAVNDVRFSPDGQILASASDNSMVGLWNVETQQTITMYPIGNHEVNGIAFSPGGSILLVATCGGINDFGDCWQGRLVLIDVATQTEIGGLTGHSADVLDVAFSPDGQTFASADEDGIINIWDATTDEIIQTLIGHEGAVNRIVFSRDGETLLSASDDSTVKRWDLTNGQVMTTFGGHISRVRQADYSADDQTILSASDDGTIRLWDVAAASEFSQLQLETELIMGIIFSPDSQMLASVGTDSVIVVWNVATGERIAEIEEFVSGINAITFNAEGDVVISAGQQIKLWDVASGSLIKTLGADMPYMITVAVSPDGNLMATGDVEGTIRIWDIGSGLELFSMSNNDNSVWQVLFSPDGQILASANPNGTVQLWDVATGEILRTLAGHEMDVFQVAFSPDRQLLASGGYDQTVKLWDVASGQELYTLTGHTDSVGMVDFSPDGTVLVSVGGTLKLWDVASGQELLTMESETSRFILAQFSPDGMKLATTNAFSIIELWNLGNLPFMRQLVQDNRFVREFTCEERARYNMSVACDVDGNFPTRTPFPSPSPIAMP